SVSTPISAMQGTPLHPPPNGNVPPSIPCSIPATSVAQVPPLPREGRKGFKFLVVVVFSLIASFVVGLFVESLDHTVRKREEIEEQLNVPYLTSLSTHYR
ncbi:MAG: hypothetical protein ACE5G2_00600, partial [Candidatus Krumholzibacteriia bacterium]